MAIIFFFVILQFSKFTISTISSSIAALFSPISHQPSSLRSTILEVTSARQMVPREKCVWPNLEAAFFFLPPPLLAPVERARAREREREEPGRDPRANDSYAGERDSLDTAAILTAAPRRVFTRSSGQPSSGRAALTEGESAFMRRACRNFRNVGVEQRGKLSLELAQGRCSRSKIEYSSRGYRASAEKSYGSSGFRSSRFSRRKTVSFVEANEKN